MRYLRRHLLFLVGWLAIIQQLAGQSLSFKTFTNPVIPGDHSDCTLTKVGNHFYTTGSSFNPTPVIYHSTDLIHWEAIAQPVSAAWSNYGDAPSGGCWGGQIVYYNNKYWDFFGRAFVMYFVTSDKPEGPWSTPIRMNTPASVPGLGADNSIFIDNDSTWYLLVKNGQVNNWILQLGKDGQPAGNIYDLTWLNPSPAYPYSWAEGPVMWKYKGYYYYSFARDVSGGQKVMRSSTLTADKASWIMLGDFFNENDPGKSKAIFSGPNHSSAAVMLDDSTSWVIHPVWARANSNEWYGQGRQGLVNQVNYDASDRPVADYPVNAPKNAPKLPSGGIPWMVPKSDFFNTGKLNPEWSFLGYTPLNSYSLTERPGWLRLKPRTSVTTSTNTVIKTDAEHNYSLMTHLDFNATLTTHEAGIRIINGMQNLYAKIYSSIDSTGQKIVCFSYDKTYYKSMNTIGNDLWLKLVRVNHILTGFYSANGVIWVQVGKQIDVSGLDNFQTSYNGWSGNRQGLYVQGSSADFDLYIYRDAYTPILAGTPANQCGTIQTAAGILDSIHKNDWALFAGVEFGNKEYAKAADSIQITASSLIGGNIEIWLDSIDTGTKIGTCVVSPTGSWTTFKTFTANINQTTGRHDVYLGFTGSSSGRLFQMKWVQFVSKNVLLYVSSSTVSDSIIKIKLDKNVIGPQVPSGFKITLNNTEKDSIKQTILNPSDSSEIILTLFKKLVFTDKITASYSPGGIKTPDGLELLSFSNNIVTNFLTDPSPRVINKQTNYTGDSVWLQLNKKMKPPDDYVSLFKIVKNSEDNITISSMSLKSNDSSVIVGKLSTKVYYEDTLTISYTGTMITSYDGYVLKNFTSIPINNIAAGYPPKITAAFIRKNDTQWNIITLRFDRPLADVSTQKVFFSVRLDGQNAVINTISGIYDSIQFSITPAVNYANDVKISYTGGSVSSLHNGLLADIIDYTIQNAIPASIYMKDVDQNNIVTIYPIPITNELKVKSKIGFNTLKIYTIEGKLILEKHYQVNINSTSLELNLNKGVYIVKLSNSITSYESKIVVE